MSSAATPYAASTDAQSSTPQMKIKGRASPSTTPSPRTSSGRKSPSILARAAMFESGGKARPTSPPTIAEAAMRDGASAVGASDASSPANKEQEAPSAATITKPTPLKRTTSPPFFPSTRPSPSSPPNNTSDTQAEHSAPSPAGEGASSPNNSQEAPSNTSSSPNKLPIAQLLEVENVLRKRDDGIQEGELDKVSEIDDAEESDGRSTPGPSGRNTPVSGRTTPIGDGSTAGSLASHAMEISDSEPESHAGPMDDDDDDAQDEGGDVEWEAFMARYWLSAGTATVAPSAAAAIVAAEDADLRPCAMEPELDEEPNALSPIRTGCIDIDMDFSFSHEGEKGSGDDGLGEMGRECSVAVARALQSGGLEELRIDVGRMAEASGRRPVKKGQVLEEEELGPADEHDAPRAVLVLREWASPTIEAPSTAGSEAGASVVSSTQTALPDPDLVHATGAILTRTSLRSMVMKKWNPGHWMHYGPHALLIFRNAEHLDDWQHNPYHGKKARDFLVKLKIDFWEDMQRDDGGGKEGVLGHRILPVKRKSYGKNEPEMYQFKLERWTNLGCSVIAAFASQKEAEVKVLHDTISKILATCPHNGLRNIDHMLK